MKYVNYLHTDSNSYVNNAPIILSQTELTDLINKAYERGKAEALKGVGVTQADTSNVAYSDHPIYN